MKKRTFAIASLAVMAIAVVSGVSAVQLFHEHTAKKTHAAWKDVYQDGDAMVRGVDAVVIARHVGTSPGRVAIGDTAEDPIPFELNHFVVETGLKGLRSGASVTVERVGGDANGETILLDADGGPYVRGQRYALFLNDQPESDFYYLVNDEGRYTVDARGRLVAAAHHGAVAARFGGMDLQTFINAVRSALPE